MGLMEGGDNISGEGGAVLADGGVEAGGEWVEERKWKRGNGRG